MADLADEQDLPVLRAASDFAYYPGVQNDASTKAFLDQFPLPSIFNALQHTVGVTGQESILIACLERVFSTKFGASLIPHYMPLIHVGLKSHSQAVKCLACKTVSHFVENCDRGTVSHGRLLNEYAVYPLLLACLIDGDEAVAYASMAAIQSFATLPEGVEIIFPKNEDESTDLAKILGKCSSLGRVRVLALIVKLFSLSTDMASEIHKSNLLGILEKEVSNVTDTLATLSVFELLYELAGVPHGTEFLSKTTFLQQLSSIISNNSSGLVFRSRAMMICGRLLSMNSSFLHDEYVVQAAVSAISGRIRCFDNSDADECIHALESLGEIGTSPQGATLLLMSSPPCLLPVFKAAFNRQGHGRQLAAICALASILGDARAEEEILLNDDAEAILRNLIYEAASRTPRLSPAGLLLSVLQQESEIRIYGYRVIKGFVARQWFLNEVCAKPELINIVTDASVETTKTGMEARFSCCKAILRAVMSSTEFSCNLAYTGLVEKLQEAVKRGPYIPAKGLQPQPAIMPGERA